MSGEAEAELRALAMLVFEKNGIAFEETLRMPVEEILSMARYLLRRPRELA